MVEHGSGCFLDGKRTELGRVMLLIERLLAFYQSEVPLIETSDVVDNIVLQA